MVIIGHLPRADEPQRNTIISRRHSAKPQCGCVDKQRCRCQPDRCLDSLTTRDFVRHESTFLGCQSEWALYRAGEQQEQALDRQDGLRKRSYCTTTQTGSLPTAARCEHEQRQRHGAVRRTFLPSQ